MLVKHRGSNKGKALVGALAGLLSFGCEKVDLDVQARKLCEQDGGVIVHERVYLPADRFDRFNAVRVPEKRFVKAGDDFFYVWDVQTIKAGNPSLKRNHFKLYRKADGKLLAEGVGYIRQGGDMPGPWHASSFRCPEHYSSSFLAQKVFLKIPETHASNIEQ